MTRVASNSEGNKEGDGDGNEGEVGKRVMTTAARAMVTTTRVVPCNHSNGQWQRDRFLVATPRGQGEECRQIHLAINGSGGKGSRVGDGDGGS